MTGINREVAEKVMGFKVVQINSHDFDPAKFYVKENDPVVPKDMKIRTAAEKIAIGDLNKCEFFVRVNRWNPDTNISYAWLVVERMRELNIPMKFCMSTPSSNGTDETIFGCHFGRGATITAKSAPLAICKAALKALQ